MTWTASLLALIERWGYVGLAVGVFLESAGVPVPGETALIAAGVAAAHGVLSLPLVIVVACASSVLGDNLGFAIGRRVGRRWIEARGRRIGITPARLARVDGFFDRFGPFAVAAARFVAGVRVIVAFVAGTTQMEWSLFLRWNVLGAIGWAATISSLSYGATRGYVLVAAMHGHTRLIVLASLAVTGGAAWLVVRWRRAVAKRKDAEQSVPR